MGWADEPRQQERSQLRLSRLQPVSGNCCEAYIRGISSELRAWNMGSFYWAGLKDGDWYSMTTRSQGPELAVVALP